MEERREYPRCLADLPVEFEVEGSKARQAATIQDLSACGAAIRRREALTPLTTLSRFRLTLEDEEGTCPLETTAVVVRSEVRESPDGDPIHFSGVQFLDLPPEIAEWVRCYVLHRLLDGG